VEVGELISFYRKQAGMTIDELAVKSGVPKGTLNKIIGAYTGQYEVHCKGTGQKFGRF